MKGKIPRSKRKNNYRNIKLFKRRVDSKSTYKKNEFEKKMFSLFDIFFTKKRSMKFNLKMSILLFFNIFLSHSVMFSNFYEQDIELVHVYSEMKQAVIVEEEYDSKYQLENGYEEAVEFIKKHEGFAEGEIYIDPSGIKTIGYGHVILKTDTFTGAITEKQAYTLLKKDFDKALKAAERETDLTGYKKIAIAHFIYAKGIGKFIRSDLKKLIIENKSIDEELKKWGVYRDKNGNIVKSKYSYNIRLWEIKMYNR